MPPQSFDAILTPEAISFLNRLQERFNPTRLSLLQRRKEIQQKIDQGWLPGFLPETEDLRLSPWEVSPVPPDLQDRRVEITGPVDRKMVINALNSGAKVFMADFEDSHSPTWQNTLNGQINLYDAVRKNITFQSPEGKTYELKPQVATLMVRPRGWHLEEKHLQLKGENFSASLFDFGLFFFHNAKELISRGSGPYFYLPKMESHLEARLWNDVFVFAQKELGIPVGTIKATVLIETILATFEMEEILYELRDHSAGLNCGRWDYIFSYIKKFRNRPEFVLPDRAQVTMNVPFMKAYYERLIATCHKREAFAMGGMAAQIPIKEDSQANAIAMEKVRADKLREVTAGHDGTWVAHPALVPLAMEIFNEHMPEKNQLTNLPTQKMENPVELLAVPEGTITEAGLRMNISVGIQYIEAWLRGNGCVPINHLMEDAATAEICRAQVWQWIRHPKGKLEDGRKITAALFKEIVEDFKKTQFKGGKFAEACQLFEELSLSDQFEEFLTLAAYPQLP